MVVPYGGRVDLGVFPYRDLRFSSHGEGLIVSVIVSLRKPQWGISGTVGPFLLKPVLLRPVPVD